MSKFSIAALQLELTSGDNRDTLESETRRALARFPWVQMVVFAELATFGAGTKFAEPMPGPTEERYRALARELGIWLIPGSYYERCEAQIFNTTPIINPQGEVIARYRKMYPFLPYEKGVESGKYFVVFDVPDVGRFGVSICYDQWFPETTRALVWNGAEVIIHPTMTGTVDRAQELVIAQANAIVNQCYFVDINNAGQLGNGRSIVVGPDGDIIHQSGEVSELITVVIDLEQVRESRRNGMKRLGQVLKSFRDTPIEFPCYRGDYIESKDLNDLGALKMPIR
jgi:predicted amidohydrolase